MQRLILTRRPHDRIHAGHPWIYDNECADVSAGIAPGEIIDVVEAGGRFVGRGYANPRSKIVVRLLTRDPHEAIDRAFFQRCLQSAWQLRQRLHLTTNCRVCFGEADGLPGLIIDKFGDALALQTHTAGMDRWQGLIIEVLQEIFAPRLIVERNDLPVRGVEGVPERKGIVAGADSSQVVIAEGDLQWKIDLLEGQKTGFFLDQRPAWAALAGVSQGARVLDGFCYVGAFALHAARAGATSVVGIDASESAITLARANAERNGLGTRCEFQVGNVFDVLTTWAKAREPRFDVIVLDPPAFTKSRGSVEAALRGYKEINRRALQLLVPGGFLLSCSCSRFVTAELLAATIGAAAYDVGRPVRQVAAITQAADHPIVWAIPETSYLKSYLVGVA